MAKSQAELVADLKSVSDQLKKVATETQGLQAGVNTLTQKVADLEAIIAQGGSITQELIDAVADVKAQVQVVDDLVPDVTPPPTP